MFVKKKRRENADSITSNYKTSIPTTDLTSANGSWCFKINLHRGTINPRLGEISPKPLLPLWGFEFQNVVLAKMGPLLQKLMNKIFMDYLGKFVVASMHLLPKMKKNPGKKLVLRNSESKLSKNSASAIFGKNVLGH